MAAPKKPTSTLRERGFVSIIVAALLMVVLALITIGFARLMQREQRQAIDRQLSRQALYAAESGVNDVIQAIADQRAGFTDPSKDTCDVSDLPVAGANGVLDASADVVYTCAMYTQAPGELQYDIDVNTSKIARMETTSGNDFATITVAWGHETPADNGLGTGRLPSCNVANASVFPPDRTDAVPLLRLDLTRIGGGARRYDRDALLQFTDYLYLSPCEGGGSSTYSFSSSRRSNIVPVPCSVSAANPDQPCEITIDSLPASNEYLARMRPVYANAAVSISATESGPLPVQFLGAQIGVDVTARAGDIVRRLYVAVPVTTSGTFPEVALQSFDGVCKQLDVNNDDPALGPIDIIDNCSSFSTPPSDPPCPTPTGSQTVINFNLSDIALRVAGGPGNEVAAVSMIDVIWDTTLPVPLSPPSLRMTNPDLDLAAALPTNEFRVNPNCEYEITYTLYCGAALPLSPFGRSPDVSTCDAGQVNEGFRTNFWSQNIGGQCSGTLLGFYDVPDQFVGTVGSAVFTDTVRLQSAVTVAADVACMEMVIGCAQSLAHIGCNNSVNDFSSIYQHAIRWVETPI